MTESIAIYGLSNPLLLTGLTILLFTLIGVLLCLVGRKLTKRTPAPPGLLPFVFYATGVICLAYALLDVPAFLFGVGSLLL